MWPTVDEYCVLAPIHDQQEASFHDGHAHHHHNPHPSSHDCYQTFSCPSSLPEAANPNSTTGHYLEYGDVFTCYQCDGQAYQPVDHELHYQHHHHHHHLQQQQQQQQQQHQIYQELQPQQTVNDWSSHAQRCDERSHPQCTESCDFYRGPAPAAPPAVDPPTPHSRESSPSEEELLAEITRKCSHFLKADGCDECRIRHTNGDEETIPIDDLIDIVYQTARNIKRSPEETGEMSKRREQNKKAAARYRDKQKTRWQTLLDERKVEEDRNAELKKVVESLEKELVEFRAKVMGLLPAPSA